MGEEKFAVIVHPHTAEGLIRSFPKLRHFPRFLIRGAYSVFSPVLKGTSMVSCANNLESVKGELIFCPLFTEDLYKIEQGKVINKVTMCANFARGLGAKIIGLDDSIGSIDNMVLEVANRVGIPVTSGLVTKIYFAMEIIKRTASREGNIDWKRANITVIGADTPVGSVCTRILARGAKYLTIKGGDVRKLDKLAIDILYETGLSLRVARKGMTLQHKTDIVVLAGKSLDLSEQEFLRNLKGKKVVYSFLPQPISMIVPDQAIIIKGGIINIPGEADLMLYKGTPAKTVYDFMVEPLLMALEKNHECFTIGREITIQQVDDVGYLSNSIGLEAVGYINHLNQIIKC